MRILAIAVCLVILSPAIGWPQQTREDLEDLNVLEGIPLKFRGSQLMVIISAQARKSLAKQKEALELLSQPPTPETIWSAHIAAAQAYRLARAAHGTLEYREAGRRRPDPMFKVYERFIHDSRFSVYKVNYQLNHGTSLDPKHIAAAIESLQIAIENMEMALTLLP